MLNMGSWRVIIGNLVLFCFCFLFLLSVLFQFQKMVPYKMKYDRNTYKMKCLILWNNFSTAKRWKLESKCAPKKIERRI